MSLKQTAKTILLLLLTIQLLLTKQIIIIVAFDYCKLDCGFAKHTVCERGHSCGPVSGCKEFEMNNDRRQWFLDAHNKLRNKLASGEESSKGFSSAGNMNILSYDKNLEYVAQCHLNRCIYQHDKCRGIEIFPYAGQNLAAISGSAEPPNEKEISNLINSWYNEISSASGGSMEKFNGNLKVAHFTQLIWAETTHIGCAISMTNNKEIYMGCNYGPGGNMINEPVYKRGASCSACKQGLKCNKKFHGLCGESTISDAIMPIDSTTLILFALIIHLLIA